MRFPIILRPTETGFCVEVPDLPVCVSTGRTFEAAIRNAREAIGLHLDGLIEDGEPIPQPSTRLEIRTDQPEEIITFLDVDQLRAA